MSKKVSLRDWASARYAKVPHDNTLRAWARNCWIFPIPEKHGRGYVVDEDARFVGKDHSNLYGSEAA